LKAPWIKIIIEAPLVAGASMVCLGRRVNPYQAWINWVLPKIQLQS
jgi:hypothetical protein